MSSAPFSADRNALPTERELRRLLTSDTPEAGAQLQDGLAHPPPDAPDAFFSLLAQIAKGARNGHTWLCSVGDMRAVQYLAGLWTLRPLTRREASFIDVVGGELECLLAERQGERFDVATEKALRGLLERAVPSGRCCQWSWRGNCGRSRPDLTETNANLLMSVVRHVAQGKFKRSDRFAQADQTLLDGVAATSALGRHYGLLRDTTKVILQGRQTQG